MKLTEFLLKVQIPIKSSKMNFTGNSFGTFKKAMEPMLNFNGFVESGALSGPSPTKFFISENNTLEDLLANLDPDMQSEVRKHLCDFHSENDMERFIDYLVHGGNYK